MISAITLRVCYKKQVYQVGKIAVKCRDNLRYCSTFLTSHYGTIQFVQYTALALTLTARKMTPNFQCLAMRTSTPENSN